MLHVDDDMDNLMRRAAENYPLNTDGADWNKVATGLQSAQPGDNQSPKNNRKFLWLLLLFPMGWICNEYTGKQISPVAKTYVVAENNNGQPLKKTDESSTTADNTTNKTQNLAPAPATASSSQHDDATDLTKDAVVAQGSKIPVHHRIINQARDFGNSFPTTKNLPLKNQLAFEVNQQELDRKQMAEKLAEEKQSVSDNDVPNNSTQDVAVEKKAEEKMITPEAAVKNDEATVEAKDKVKVSKSKNINKGLYAGILAGPDITRVKGQSVKNTGLTAGVLVGYQFSKRLALESGVFWDKKYYYSSGEYFDTKRTYIPPTYKVDNINGDCEMIEWSMNARYNIIASSKSNLFSTVGVSSYFMKQEDYDYSYKYYGNTTQRHSSYSNSSNNLFSMANISVGYTHAIGHGINLRVEPYVKLPLRGVGIGNLHLSSTGVYLGATKKIF